MFGVARVGPAAAWEPRLWFRRGLGVPGGTEIMFGVVRVRTGAVQNPPITLSAGPRDTQTHRDHIWGRTREDRALSNNPNHTLGRTEGHSDPPKSYLGSHAWGPHTLQQPRLCFRRGVGAGWHRDHVWGYSALARAKPGTDGATGYAVLPLRFHRNARQGHTLFLASPAKATSRTPGLHTPEDSNFDLGLLQGSETHRSTCGPAQA